MISAVFDTNLLVSAFLSRNNYGGVSNELLRFVRDGAIELHLSPDIAVETLATLVESERAQRRYSYTPAMALEFCDSLLAVGTIVVAPPTLPGAVSRDPDDDMIIECAVAASVEYIVTRDDDLLSLRSYADITMITPEEFIHIVRRGTAACWIGSLSRTAASGGKRSAFRHFDLHTKTATTLGTRCSPSATASRRAKSPRHKEVA
jgi:putative PIN family toxin of toxin-antitoxin system